MIYNPSNDDVPKAAAPAPKRDWISEGLHRRGMGGQPPQRLLKDSRRFKVEQYVDHLLNDSPEFQEDLRSLIALGDSLNTLPHSGVLLSQFSDLGRSSIPQNPSRHLEFQKAVDTLCWKWRLEGFRIQDGRFSPIPLEPMTKTGPMGTYVFIPSYVSLDATRDIDWRVLNTLHRQTGVRRQGLKDWKNAQLLKQQALTAIEANNEARAKDLHGESRMVHIKSRCGLCPTTDDSRVRALLRKGRALMASYERSKRLPRTWSGLRAIRQSA